MNDNTAYLAWERKERIWLEESDLHKASPKQAKMENFCLRPMWHWVQKGVMMMMMLIKLLTFESVDEIMKRNYLKKGCWSARSCILEYFQ